MDKLSQALEKFAGLIEVPTRLANQIERYTLGRFSAELLEEMDREQPTPLLAKRLQEIAKPLRIFLRSKIVQGAKEFNAHYPGPVYFPLKIEEIAYSRPSMLMVPDLVVSAQFIPSFKPGVKGIYNQEAFQALWEPKAQKGFIPTPKGLGAVITRRLLGKILIAENIPETLDRLVISRNPLQLLQETFQNLRESIEHELQHLVQTFLQFQKFMEADQPEEEVEIGGLPSSKDRNLRWNPVGFPAKDPTNPASPRLPHQLRDIEFYPNLADSIQSFKRVRITLPLWLHSLLLQAWVGQISRQDFRQQATQQAKIRQSSDSSTKKLLEEALTKADFALKYQNHFFLWLKKHQPLKYQKAVKEFYKAVS